MYGYYGRDELPVNVLTPLAQRLGRCVAKLSYSTVIALPSRVRNSNSRYVRLLDFARNGAIRQLIRGANVNI